MKRIAYIFYLFLLLPFGSLSLHASEQECRPTEVTVMKTIEKQSDSIANKDQDTTVIEDTDWDWEEEYVNVERTKDSNASRFSVQKYAHPFSWHSSPMPTFTVNQNYNIFQVVPGHTSPIYITQRVLRI